MCSPREAIPQGLGRANGSEHAVKCGSISGLGEVMVKPNLLSPATIIGLTPASQCHKHGSLEPVLRSEPACNFVAVHPRHSQVQQDDLRSIFPRGFDRTRTIVGGPYVVPRQEEQFGEAVGRVPVVVHNQNPT